MKKEFRLPCIDDCPLCKNKGIITEKTWFGLIEKTIRCPNAPMGGIVEMTCYGGGSGGAVGAVGDRTTRVGGAGGAGFIYPNSEEKEEPKEYGVYVDSYGLGDLDSDIHTNDMKEVIIFFENIVKELKEKNDENRLCES